MEGDTREVLREVSHRYPPSAFYSAGEFFRTLHKQTKAETRHYSYRQLSLDLGFSATNLVHLIVQGKRPVTEKAAGKIVEALDLRKDERRYFLALAKLTRGKKSDDFTRNFREALEIRGGMLSTRLDTDQQAFYEAWYHPVIRELLLLEDFQADPKWMAQKVWPAISPEQAEESFSLLQRLNLIRYDEQELRWVQVDPVISTGPESLSPAVKAYHRESIPHGLMALENLPVERRQISGLILSVNMVQFERIKQEIELFQQKLLELEGDRAAGPPQMVVRVNTQFFPSTVH